MTIDLTTRYGSLTLASPIIVGACPLTSQDQTRVAIESAGAGAIVLPSLFEEQIVHWNQTRGIELSERELQLSQRSERMQDYSTCKDADTYLAIVNRASAQLNIPVIASLNGESDGNWLDFAGEVEEAGAAAIELAVHHSDGLIDAGPREIEESLVRLVVSINNAISIPLFLKLEREYTSVAHLARHLVSGCQGLVLYGRKPNVEICLDSLTVRHSWGLTEPGSIVGSLGSIMRVHASCPAMSLAACGGIGTVEDVIRALLAGADAVMVTSELYRNGPDVIRSLVDGLVEYMDHNGIQSIHELQTKRPLEFSSEDERVAYTKALSSRVAFPGSGDLDLHGDRFGHLDTGTSSE
ncbi:beta/alpha barrel domain-containing protein [Rubripirellula reticaptiva]|uniref:Dihydroorotate dehydrogenase B (NAD(+)), catalytic subunit n=1 Tax=Rubripirellula reticaptiva TaxID=2528013 RepID=A0A5C6F2B2_9BACT|nr:dihydroorotate dehydrogenase [Rubripirellula reticaptiva]TWU55255.1 Dihydroorotate dehydrogenase B (NAD(+)), catalytic subunit [Rubripirellula reticaptiva]